MITKVYSKIQFKDWTIKTYIVPRPFIIIEDFYTKDQLKKVLSEIQLMQDFAKPGKFNYEGKEQVNTKMKKNNVISVDDIYRDNREKSTILKKFTDEIWNDRGLVKSHFISHQFPCFEYLNYTLFDSTQISVYGDNDLYKYHIDTAKNISFMTFNILVCNKPKSFTGGDMLFANKGKIVSIPFKNNTCIIYSTSMHHRVTTVHCKDNKFENKRYSINQFCWCLPDAK